ncbi:hypothetical protein IKG45_03010 [Candidatus Saccharibacteria bacterium]|nr:hypothetical protein [Candidatus Saccharibacteria bacterium]
MNKKLLLSCLAVGISFFAGQLKPLTANAESLSSIGIGIGSGGPSQINISALEYGSGSSTPLYSILRNEAGTPPLSIACHENRYDICQGKVAYDAEKNTLTLKNVSADKGAEETIRLEISYLDDLTIDFVGENNLGILAHGTNLTLDGDGMTCSISAEMDINSTACIASYGGTITFKNGNYDLSHFSSPVMAELSFVGNEKIEKRIIIGDNEEIKDNNLKIAHDQRNHELDSRITVYREYFAYNSTTEKDNSEDISFKLANKVKIGPKEKKQTEILPVENKAKTEAGTVAESAKTKKSTEKTPNTGHFEKEFSATLASIFGTVAIVTVSTLLLALLKKKSKKEINYY